jgi:1,2-phenylacetyl-CoA epoxidase catalytic subunit
VAAAAMAQDELGHARSTYPVLAKLGYERGEPGLDTSNALPLLREELPDWASMIAANLVIDGILTTWIASARDSTIDPLAQRARKILQEEGAHKVHAEAWAKRLCRAGGPDRELLLARVAEAWDQAARWPGPDDDDGYRAILDADMLAVGPAEVRRQVRDWLTALLGNEGCAATFDEPADWSGWDETRRS